MRMVLAAITIAARVAASAGQANSQSSVGKRHQLHTLGVSRSAAMVRRHEHQFETVVEARGDSDLIRSGRAVVVAANGDTSVESTYKLAAAEDHLASGSLWRARPEASGTVSLQEAPTQDLPDTALDFKMSSRTSPPHEQTPILALRQDEMHSFIDTLHRAPSHELFPNLHHSNGQSEIDMGIRSAEAGLNTESTLNVLSHTLGTTNAASPSQSAPPGASAAMPTVAAWTSNTIENTSSSIVPTVMSISTLPVVRGKLAVGLGQVLAAAVFDSHTSAKRRLETTTPALTTPATSALAVETTTSAALPAEPAAERDSTAGSSNILVCICLFCILFIISGMFALRWTTRISSSRARHIIPPGTCEPGPVCRGPSTPVVASERLHGGTLEYTATIEEKNQSYWSGTLLKLNEDGEPQNENDWRERQVWIGQTGVLYYWSKKDTRVTVIFDGVAIQELIIKKLPSAATCHPYGMSIEKRPSMNPDEDPNPSYFATNHKETLMDFVSAANALGNRSTKKFKI